MRPAGRLGAALLLAAGLPVGVAAEEGAGAALHQRLERAGLVFEVRLEPAAAGEALVEGTVARAAVRITDAGGNPLSGLYPAAWLDRLPVPGGGGRGDGEAVECGTKVAAFLGGSLLTQPEGDLNVYHVVTLNEDPTLSVVDPLFGFGGSKLLDLVKLRGPGADWALSADGERLFVSIPDHAVVAVIETSGWEVLTYAEVGRRPGRMALQPDGRYLWVAYGEPFPGAEASGVTVVDTGSMKPVTHLPTGRGEHDLAVSDDGLRVFVTNFDDGTTTVIDVAELAAVATVDTGDGPVSVAYSPLARTALVAHRDDGTLAVLDAETGEVVGRAQGKPGLEQVRIAPGGRLAFAVNPRTDQLHVVDTANRRIVQTGTMESGPDQVTFSDELAYVRHRASEIVLMVPLSEVGRPGAPIPVVDFTGGHAPPGRTALPTPAAGIVQAPGASAVLVANPDDRAIYYYKEGMAAPMGHFKNYGRKPRAVKVVDRSLRETAPGTYETVVPLHRPGVYELALFIDSPRTVECLPFTIAEDPVRAASRGVRRAALVALDRPGRPPAGEELVLRYRVSDPRTGEAVDGLDDMGVLGFLAPGVWQQRRWAEPRGDGIYEVRLTPPRPGVYYVFPQVPSLDLDLGETPALIFEVVERPHPPSDASTSSTSMSSEPPAPAGAVVGSNS